MAIVATATHNTALLAPAGGPNVAGDVQNFIHELDVAGMPQAFWDALPTLNALPFDGADDVVTFPSSFGHDDAAGDQANVNERYRIKFIVTFDGGDTKVHGIADDADESEIIIRRSDGLVRLTNHGSGQQQWDVGAGFLQAFTLYHFEMVKDTDSPYAELFINGVSFGRDTAGGVSHTVKFNQLCFRNINSFRGNFYYFSFTDDLTPSNSVVYDPLNVSGTSWTATGGPTGTLAGGVSASNVFRDYLAEAGSIEILLGAQKMPRHVVRFDSDAKTGLIRLRQPGTLVAGSTVVFDIDVDDLRTEPAANDPIGSQAVWQDDGLRMLLQGNAEDATGNYTVAEYGSVSYLPGGGVSLVNSGFNFTLDSSFDVATGYTFSFYGNINNFSQWAPLFRNGANFSLQRHSSSTTNLFVSYGGAQPVEAGFDEFTTGSEHYFSFVFNDTDNRVYRDGALQSTVVNTWTPAPAGLMTLFYENASINVDMDLVSEISFTNEARSADWLLAEKNNRDDPLAWFTLVPVTGGGTTVNPDDLSIGLSVGQPVITQSHVLQPDSASFALAAGSPGIVQQHSITPDELALLLSVDSPGITQAFALAPEDVALALSVGIPSLTQVHVIAPTDVLVALEAASPGITPAGLVAPDDVSMPMSVDDAVVLVAGSVSPDDVRLAVLLDTLAVVQQHNISPDDVSLALPVDPTVISAAGVAIAPVNVGLALSVDTVDITQFNVITPGSITLDLLVDVVSLGGLVVGELEGQIFVYAAIDGEVKAFPALSGTVH